MSVFRRVDDDRAGPAAMGILVPPGRRTFLILRPRALAWDLILLRRAEGSTFRVDRWTGRPRTDNAEGTLEWVELGRVLTLPLWEGDRHFLPLVFDRDVRQFHGVMPYRDGRPLGWSYSLL